MWCWGWDSDGQVGDGNADQENKSAPVQLDVRDSATNTPVEFTDITAGYRHSCGVDSDGAAWCWGRDKSGQVGDGDDDQEDELAPVQVALP